MKDGSAKSTPSRSRPEKTRRKKEIPPNPKRLVRMLASVGHTLPSAVADIVDNAISKHATEINILFSRPDDGHGRWMSIKDNGVGMNEEALSEAMRIGSNAQYDSDDLGKYGYGLKGASWSQTDCFTVVSKTQNNKLTHHLTWDVQRMDSWEVQDEPLEPWLQELTRISGHGTCVIWRDMRPPRIMPIARGVDSHTAEQLEIERHLALVFHRFIEGKASGKKRVVINMDGRPIAPNNPVGHELTRSYDRKTVRIPTDDKDAFAQIQAFLLPSEQEVRDLHGDGAEVRKDLERLGMYGRRNESQGVYVYRKDRLIQWGGWHEMWTTSDEKTKLARVTVEFDSDLDTRFEVNISKQKVTLSQQLQAEIKLIAAPARNDSKRKYVSPRKSTTPSTTAPSAGGSSSTKKGSPSPLSGGSAPSKPNAILPVRPVRTDKFAWKLISKMTGGLEVQVSDKEAQLQSLLRALADNAEGMVALTDFLHRLDRAGIQPILVSSPTEP